MLTPLTLNGPIPFGYHRDGTPAAAEMRQRNVAVVGELGSGKTTVEHNLTAGLVRCPDCVVWMIDLGGGGLAMPWLNPWLDRDMGRPVIDWVAAELDEALLMTQMAVEVILHRRRVYRGLMRRHDTDKLPVSADVPGIYIVLDEGKEATGLKGHPQLQSNLNRIGDLGRAMAVRLLVSGLRATADVLPTGLMADMGIRIGMSVASEGEFGYLMGWRMKLNPRDFPYPGCGIWRDGMAGTPQPFRSFDLTRPSRIATIAQACEPWRPALDEPSLEVPHAGEYAGRWERTVAHLDADPVSTPVSTRRAQPGEHPVSSPGEQPGALDAALARARHVIAGERVKAAPPDAVEAEFARIADQLGDDRAAGGEGWRDEPLAQSADARERMREIVRAAGPAGISGPKVQEMLETEGHEVPRSTLYRWLAEDCAKAGYGAYRAPESGGQV